MLPSHGITMILAKLSYLITDFSFDDRTVDTQAHAQWVDHAVAAETVATLHVALQ